METQRVTRETIASLFAERNELTPTAEENDGGLTAAGWPRERVNGWPIPWISPRRALSQTDENRFQACATGAVCAVCGLGFQVDESALAICRPPDGLHLQPGDTVVPSSEDGGITPIDNGILHHRCARLALAYCPKLNELLEDDELVAIEVIAHDAVPRFLDTGREDGKTLLTATFATGVVAELPL
jgi:hypothetical protein